MPKAAIIRDVINDYQIISPTTGKLIKVAELERVSGIRQHSLTNQITRDGDLSVAMIALILKAFPIIHPMHLITGEKQTIDKRSKQIDQKLKQVNKQMADIQKLLREIQSLTIN